MANRILRDTTDSVSVNNLSFGAEVLFYRLFMKADDFGSFHANTALIKGILFPLKNLPESTIKEWLNECISNNLIIVYSAQNKPYLRILNFNQRLRNMRNKFPSPTNEEIESAANCSESLPETKQKQETETKQETEFEGKKNLTDFYLKDLENSESLSVIGMRLNLTIDQVKSYIPGFSKKANLEYHNNNEFIKHFKNYIAKELNGKSSNNNRQTGVDALNDAADQILRATGPKIND